MALGLLASPVSAQVTFSQSTVLLPGLSARAAAVGDFNGDGKPDIVVVRQGTGSIRGSQDSVTVLLGDGQGGFTEGQTQTLGLPHTGNVSYVAVGDLNRDGRLDVVIAHSRFFSDDPTEGVLVLLGQGDGTFGSPAHYPLPASSFNTGVVFHVAIGDLNRDGKPDVAVARFTETVEGVYVFPGDGTGGLGTAVYALNTEDNDSVAIADFNLDGKLDLAAIDEKAHFAVGLGDGALGFAQTDLDDVRGSFQLEAADLNADGRPDLVSAAVDGVQVFYKLQNGTGFSAGTQLPLPTPGTTAALSIVVTDVDGDGKADIVARHNGPGGAADLAAFLNAGDGTFGATTVLADLSGLGPRDVISGDFDRDGRPDMAVVLNGNASDQYAGAGILVFLNTTTFPTSGTFGPATAFATGNGPAALAVGLIGRGAAPDVVTADLDGGTVTVLPGNGHGGFVTALTFPVAPGATPVAVALADFNRNGFVDAVVANRADDSVCLKFGAQQGVFTLLGPCNTVGMGDGPAAVAVGDLNRDGIPDIVVTDTLSDRVTVRRGNGTALAAPISYPVGNQPVGLALGDLNGDGKLDLVVANRGDDTLTVRLGTGSATNPFGLPTVISGLGNGPSRVVLGDLDRDGKLDAVVANVLGGSISVLLGDGAGGFAAPITFPTPGGLPVSLALADLDRDGILDLAVVRSRLLVNAAGVVLVYRGTGTGGFARPEGYPVGVTPSAVAIVDLDFDGRLDLVVTNRGDDTVSVLLNNAAPSP